ncbi:helix-turn-helix transcriptional regulator [Microbacterium karelineae]|uniref:helix-turn-helix transcriptional regulator n=1 Tax=Microbacterium karelineae TaxID=2654283 RepID=UPI0012E9DFA3|nr:DNA-binding response regulator [Microbacterium karelineae]
MSTMTRTNDSVVVVRGEQEVFRRAGRLFENASEITCAANDLAGWGWRQGGDGETFAYAPRPDARVRKLFRSSALLDPGWDARIAAIRAQPGDAEIRVTTEEVNETIIIDGRVAILAGDRRMGERGYSILTLPDTVHGVASLFESAWRSATDLDVYDAEIAGIRMLAPRVLDLLGSGVKDEAAARMLGLSVRTYRRRVAELMTALGADSRFQAGVRARELGLV